MVHGLSILDIVFGKCLAGHVISSHIHQVSRSCPCHVAESMALFTAGPGTWRPPLMSLEPLEPRTRPLARVQHGAERPRGWSEEAVARSNHRQRHLWTRVLDVTVVNPTINLPYPWITMAILGMVDTFNHIGMGQNL